MKLIKGTKMEIIDAHAHIYPNKIADKATKAIGDFYDLNMEKSGTAENLIINGEAVNVSKYIVHSCATKPEQVRSINTFIKEEKSKHKEFLGFMTLHQDLEEKAISEEIEWCIKEGFYGIKLHPDFQKFYIDGENANKIYRALSDFNKTFPILFHTGDNRYEYSKPYRLANVAKKYKNLQFIGAHFGGYRCWDDVDVYNGLKNVFFDTSSSLPFIKEKKAKELIYKFGAEKFFFGSDFPMWDVCDELERFLQIDLTDNEKEMILSKNIKSLLDIK